jgi:hypothetical protein
VIHERAASTGRGALEEVSKLGELDVSTDQAALHSAVLARQGCFFLAIGSSAEMFDDARPRLGSRCRVRLLAPSERVVPAVEWVTDGGARGQLSHHAARARVPQVLDPSRPKLGQRRSRPSAPTATCRRLARDKEDGPRAARPGSSRHRSIRPSRARRRWDERAGSVGDRPVVRCAGTEAPAEGPQGRRLAVGAQSDRDPAGRKRDHACDVSRSG